VFSNDIWLGDNLGESLAFAKDVKISGWTNVGDKPGGGYVGECCSMKGLSWVTVTYVRSSQPVYDCVIKTKEVSITYARL